MDRLGDDRVVFEELRGLLLDLVALVERSESIEQAVDAELAQYCHPFKNSPAQAGTYLD